MGKETDRELLELAAKAAGIDLEDSRTVNWWYSDKKGIKVKFSDKAYTVWWNPLEDDGDALRLAVKLKFTIHIWDCDGNRHREGASVAKSLKNGESPSDSSNNWKYEESGEDEYKATRRAIVRAAAEIGKEMK